MAEKLLPLFDTGFVSQTAFKTLIVAYALREKENRALFLGSKCIVGKTTLQEGKDKRVTQRPEPLRLDSHISICEPINLLSSGLQPSPFFNKQKEGKRRETTRQKALHAH